MYVHIELEIFVKVPLPRMMFLFLILIHLWHDYKKLFPSESKVFEPTTVYMRFLCDCLLLKGVSDFFLNSRDFSLALLLNIIFSEFFSPIFMRATRNQILILYTPWALQYDWSQKCIQGTKMWCEQHYKMRTRCLEVPPS